MTTPRSIGLVATIVGLSLFAQVAGGQLSPSKIEATLGKKVAQRADPWEYTFRGAIEDSTENRQGDVGGLIENFQAERKTPDLWVGKDKCRHFLLSGFWSGFSYLLCHRHLEYSEEKSLLISGGVVFSLGVTKEIRDGFQPDNRFSYKDLLFDVVGIGCGLFLASR
ncbi:MAG: hypothetical protein ACE5JC_00715 [Candidatus Zixiibacteriota bacterium]